MDLITDNDIDLILTVEAQGDTVISNNYNDLENQPSINNVTLTGNKTTEDLGISYNDLEDLPDIPDKTSDLINDSGFLTEHQVIPDIPTKTSDLINDSGFLTEHQDLSDYATNDDLNFAIAGVNEAKQNKLTAGDGIKIKTVLGQEVISVIGGGGSGGTTDYDDLSNKPKINGVTLEDNKTDTELGLQKKLTAGANIVITDNGVISGKAGIELKVVAERPLVGEPNYIYLVPKTEPSGEDNYNQWIYSEDTGWEDIGNTTPNLSDYIRKSDSQSVVYVNDATGTPATKPISDFAMSSDLSGKVDKPASDAHYAQIQAIEPNGTEKAYSLSLGWQNGQIPLWKTGGRLDVGTPTTNADATPKKYVDTAVASVLPAFTSADEGKVLGIVNGALAWVYFADLDNTEYPQENE